MHTTLRSFQVEFDLCLLLHDGKLRREALESVSKNSGPGLLGSRGGVFVLDKETLPPEVLTLLRAVARHTSLRGLPQERAAAREYLPVEVRTVAAVPLPAHAELSVNGGVFQGGRFYVDKTSPLPYSHVLAAPHFGTLVSDKALGYTWAVNSRENKLTPWYNDICTDNEGELLLVWDGGGYYNLINGARASFHDADARYEGRISRLESRVTVTVEQNAKLIDVRLRNRTDRACAVQCAYYTEPVLGVNRETARYIRPEVRGDALVMRNVYNTVVKCCAALRAEGGEGRFLTDRVAFLCGDWQGSEPRPSGDPCAAVIVPLQLPPKKEVHIRYILSFGATAGEAVENATPDDDAGEGMHGGTPPSSAAAPARNRLVINTPDRHLNQFVNHFAPHQILHSRIWGRTAFYQCGGAFGFRDQLQDVCAYLLLDSGVAREQILRCCGVQFPQGDVLHWWHALPADAGGLKGVRTKFSDDLLWLPMAVAEYVQKTGDVSVLEEQVHYIECDLLDEKDHERYISPCRSELCEDVYAHCVRALERGYNLGEGGLPLIGCGDWCDGFSAVGLEGRGRSVWLALFLARVLTEFVPVCRLRGDEQRAVRCREWAESLKAAVDAHAWDGRWYLRAFYDDGGPMGTHRNQECHIDLLSQTFAVFADMPDKERVDTAVNSALELLWDRELRVVKLFEKPFQHSPQQPGYVKAYPPGIRENGGQYTHSAVWFAMALLERGHPQGGEILSALNPVRRASLDRLAELYKLEPYYMAADIYTNPGAAGRGGWSMYTGAASWYYRAVMEILLGLTLRGDRVFLHPHLPNHWPEASLDAVVRGTAIRITMRHGDSPGLRCDGKPAKWIALDGKSHIVEVVT